MNEKGEVLVTFTNKNINYVFNECHFFGLLSYILLKSRLLYD